jgi:hypothetical protein
MHVKVRNLTHTHMHEKKIYIFIASMIEIYSKRNKMYSLILYLVTVGRRILNSNM